MTNRFLVFTDLDGTLLDHETYDHTPAAAALAELAARAIPVIPTTSKTVAEMRIWQVRLGLDGPFIVENGSALVVPAGSTFAAGGRTADGTEQTFVFGAQREQILQTLDQLNRAGLYDYTGFADMTAAVVARETGLDLASATNAKARQWSEPLLWRDTPAALEQFSAEIAAAGLHATRGGRFVHVMGKTNKGEALKHTAKIAATPGGTRWRTIALGDSPNDAEMLEAADIAVVVKNPHSVPPSIERAGALYTTASGPAGWREAMAQLLRSHID